MITPESEEALAAFVRESAEVRPVGSGTKQHYGPAPAEPNVCLRRVDRIIAYEPGDLVVTVQAGMRLADLQEKLAEHGQWLPIDPPYAAATIGGILATNSSGPRRLGYGTMRDLLLGLRVIGAGGIVTRSGGRVVKNVTGYDLHKLHIGAFGSLGVMTEASFKLHPLPEISAVIVREHPTFEKAHASLLDIHASPLRPVALEVLDRNAAALHPDLPDGNLAIMGVEGSRPIVQRHGGDALEGDAAARVWAALRDLPERSKDFVQVRIGAKPYDLPGRIAEFGLSAGVTVHAGTGVARLSVEWSDDLPGRIRRANAGDGYAVAESAPRGHDRLPWGFENDMMKKIRAWRDPDSVFNRGSILV